MSDGKQNDAAFRAVNIGCGPRFMTSPAWMNFDFQSRSPHVRRCNLLRGIPLPANSVDLIYSSHMLEHFSLEQAKSLLLELRRLLRPGGTVRIVVPDLEDVCRNYLRALADVESVGGKDRHSWAVVELIDQMVRTTPGGEMARMFQRALLNGEEGLRRHIQERTGLDVRIMEVTVRRSAIDRLRGVSASVLWAKILSLYLALLRHLLPRDIRELVIDGTPPGEKHKWMYDRVSLGNLLSEAGFVGIEFHSAHTSGCAEFLAQNLDLNADGSPYKRSSLYAEARK